MISNQVLQHTIDGLKNITNCDLSVIDSDGRVLATTEVELIGQSIECTNLFIDSSAEMQTFSGYNYFKVFDNNVVEYIIAAKGANATSYTMGQLATFHIQSLLFAYKERYDKDNFIKNLLLDNMLLVDIYTRAKKMQIKNNTARVVYILDIDSDKEEEIIATLKDFWPSQRDFLTVIDKALIAFVYEVKEYEPEEQILEVAEKMLEFLESKLQTSVKVAIGTKVPDLKKVPLSYKEAHMALEVGKIFTPDRKIIHYAELGLGRLICQLPKKLCNVFMTEMLGDVTILDHIDDEMNDTVLKFFECNLNVSGTAKQLYIHRNTLVYRLDKLEKLTNLDLRNFGDAVIFKIIIMINAYLAHGNGEGEAFV